MPQVGHFVKGFWEKKVLNAKLISGGGRGLKSQEISSDLVKFVPKRVKDRKFGIIWANSQKVLDFLPDLW